jgi:hypothetical protein
MIIFVSILYGAHCRMTILIEGQQTDDYMNSSSESNYTLYWNSSTASYEIIGPLGFWLFFIFDAFAILCSIFVLYHLLAKHTLRQALHNHALILILLFGLVYEILDIPLHMQFFSTGIVRPATPELCRIWWFIDWGFYYTIEVLLLFASIERHILIFHSRMLATRRKRLLIHYLPLLLIILFMMTFYSIALFSPICQNMYDYTTDLCGMYACYTSIPLLSMFEQVGFSTVPSCFIAVFSMLLLVRVVWQNHRMRRSIQWRKQRKLAIQVILMALLFLVFSFPLTVIHFVRLWGLSNWAFEVFPPFFFLSYFPIFFLPFVCLASLPKLCDTIKKLDPRRRQRRRVAAIIVR